jgi:hypothetical protein
MDGLIEGRIIHYVLSKDDAEAINKRRHAAESHDLNDGTQLNTGNHVMSGEHVPGMIVAIFPNEFGKGIPGVNVQCLLDGSDSYWVTSKQFDNDLKLPGTVHWIERAKESL